MKLLKALILLVLLASVVNSVPTKDEDALVDHMEDGDLSDKEMHIEHVLKGMQYEPETDIEANNYEGTCALNLAKNKLYNSKLHVPL